MSKEYELETGSVVSWIDGVDPEDWRDEADDEDQYEDALDLDDEDVPTPQYIIDILGFNPDDEKYDEELLEEEETEDLEEEE